MKILLQYFMENEGKLSLFGLIATMIRGYGTISFLRSLSTTGIGSIMIMLEHLKRCHPFAGKSLVDLFREQSSDNDIHEDIANGTRDQDGRVDDGDPHSENDYKRMTGTMRLSGRGYRDNDSHHAMTGGRHLLSKAIQMWALPVVLPKKIVTARQGERKALVRAIVVREHDSQKDSRIVRFLYAVAASISEALETWIAVPRLFGDVSQRIFMADGETSRQRAKME